MTLMLLSQASLFADKGLIGLDSANSIAMSKNGNVAVSYETGSGTSVSLNFYKKVSGAWEKTVKSPFTYVRSVKLSEDGTKVALATSSGNNFYPDTITVFDLNLSTMQLTQLHAINAGQNIWYFDLNSLGVVYTVPGSSLKLYRFSDSSTQTISFAEIENNSAAWFTTDASLNFKWSGKDNTSTFSVGTVSVLSPSTFTRTVTQTNLQSSSGDTSDFSRNVFSYVGANGSGLSCFVVNDSIVQTFSVSGFFGLPTGWSITTTKISDDGSTICVLLNDSFNPVLNRIYLLTKGSTNFSIAGFVEYTNPLPHFPGPLAVNSSLREFLVENNLGSRYFIV